MSTSALPIHFDGLSLPVSDVDRSVAFYRDKLGFTVEQHHGKSFALLRLGAVSLGLLGEDTHGYRGARTLGEEQRRTIELEFTTDDLEQVYAELVARGVVFRGPPKDKPWERSAQAVDPDGYTIEFAQGKRGANAPGAKRSSSRS